MSETDENINMSNATFQCMNCGASLKYKPGTTFLHCDYCNTDTPIDIKPVEEVVELDFEKYAGAYEEINLKATKIIGCRKCGAESTFDENTKSIACPYCNTPLIESDAHEERLIQASYILPFHIADDCVNEHLHKWLKSLWFAPNKLKRRAMQTDQLQGLYIPCWTYDAQTETSYTGKRGDTYTVTVGSGNNKRTEIRTRWTYCSGNVSLFFDDIMVSASKHINQALLDQVSGGGGWDTINMVEADNRFLSGFSTEKYTTNLRDGFNTAKRVINDRIDSEIRYDIGGDEQQIDSKDTKITDIKFKLILLPVYISSYTYKNKLYSFYMNGRNGHITGSRPYSTIKIILAIIAGLLAIAGIYYMYTQQ
ncbi:hypothetical protein [Dysgonomonas sp. ZJ709]|uniref:hypothetical protein n=1 Tax=Dysgonomonas sp. ZJ709 TaxID=2709797 RepID=UPI0013ED7127|nr:hypothetical protein [Dysgonomonas sp. ZJ709]